MTSATTKPQWSRIDGQVEDLRDPHEVRQDLGDRLVRALLAQEVRAQPEQDDLGGDVVEHDGRDDLVRAGLRLEDARDEAPERRRSAMPAMMRHEDDQRHRLVLERDGGDRGPEGAEDELALDADVEHAAAERDRDREAGEDAAGVAATSVSVSGRMPRPRCRAACRSASAAPIRAGSPNAPDDHRAVGVDDRRPARPPIAPSRVGRRASTRFSKSVTRMNDRARR